MRLGIFLLFLWEKRLITSPKGWLVLGVMEGNRAALPAPRALSPLCVPCAAGEPPETLCVPPLLLESSVLEEGQALQSSDGNHRTT